MSSLVDPRTLLLVITLILVCRSALLGYVWYINRTYPPVRLWAVGSTAMACGVLLVSLRDIAPLLVSVVGGQALVISGWMIISAGTLRAAGANPPWRAGVALAVGALALATWFLVVRPDYALRTIAVTLPGLIFDSYVALVCLRGGTANRQQTTLRILAIVLLLSVITGVLKNLHVLHAGTASPVDPGWQMGLFYLVSILTVFSCSVFYVLLAAQKIQTDLDAELEERKRAEKSMRLAALVYQTSGEGMIVTDGSGVIIDVNPAFTSLTGYSREEAIGRTPRILKSGRQDTHYYEAMWRDLISRGEWKGELWNRHKDGSIFAERLTINTLYDVDRSVQHYVGLFHDVTQQRLSAEKIFFQANHDRLTHLANRYAFFERLAVDLSKARRAGTSIALLFMDLNRFKPVNDQFGHEAGDHVLKVVADRWRACIRSSDALARMGGDEFALLIGGVESPEETRFIAQKLISSLEPPIDLPGGQRCQVGCSIGIAIYPDNAQEMDSLIAAADAAMYDNKATGVSGYALSSIGADELSMQAQWIMFNEASKVGVAEIDDQHRQLVEMLNTLNRAVMSGRSDNELKALFEQLLEFAKLHFATEQSLMEIHHYQDRDEHQRQHDELTVQLGEIFRRFEDGDEIRLLQTTKDWLIGHIRHADKSLGVYLNDRGIS